MPDMQAAQVRVTTLPPALQQRHCCYCCQQAHKVYAALFTAAVLQNSAG
jgi:hypothetical protein